MKLTQSKIEKLEYEGTGKSRDVRWDDSLAGFGVRVYPSGKKAFVVSYRNKFRVKKLMTLGTFGVVTLHQARDKAKKMLVSVNEGDDPLEERKKVAHGETVSKLCKTYLERHAKPRKKTWKEDERRIERHIKPNWGNRKVESITRQDVAGLHSKIGKDTPYEANRTLEIIRKMFNLASVWGYLPESHMNPANKIERFKEKKRDVWIKPEEFPRLVEAIENEPNIYARAAIWLYLLTGLRKNELLKAKWDQVDKERAELYLPDTKSGRPHVVPLNKQALLILKNLPKKDDNEHIIPGSKKGLPFINLQRAWERIRKNGGFEHVRIHDLRRSVGSWLAMDGKSLLVISQTLNQSNLATTKIYARLTEDPVRRALDDLGNRLVAVSGKSDSASIIEFPRKTGNGKE